MNKIRHLEVKTTYYSLITQGKKVASSYWRREMSEDLRNYLSNLPKFSHSSYIKLHRLETYISELRALAVRLKFQSDENSLFYHIAETGLKTASRLRPIPLNNKNYEEEIDIRIRIAVDAISTLRDIREWNRKNHEKNAN